jgi:hypothetical protein
MLSLETSGDVPLTSCRVIKRFTAKKCFFFPSIGHLILFAVYLAINIKLILTDVSPTSLMNVAKWLGWYLIPIASQCTDTEANARNTLATANVCLTFVLAMKNTPLSVLMSFSYEKLNILHQATGYMTTTLATLHGM